MSEIPKDVMADAEEIWGEAWAERWREDKQPPKPALMIAKAIMEERARCVKICEDEYEKRMDSDYPMSRKHDFCVVARLIQKAIRSQTLAD